MKKININSNVEKNIILATIFKKNKVLNRINLSNPNEILQTSILNVKKNNIILAHKHNHIRRETYGTQEVWIIKKGKGVVGFYDLNDEFLCFAEVSKGDLILNFRGGHSLKAVSRNMILLEIKNGPYGGSEVDKIQIDI